MRIFDQIKKIAQAKDIAISTLEKECDLSNGSISKWNQSIPNADKLYKVALYLNMPIEYFLLEQDISTEDRYTQNELILLSVFRKLSTNGQEEIIRYANYVNEHQAFPLSTSSAGKKTTVSRTETA